jgi:hypothetical protein
MRVRALMLLLARACSTRIALGQQRMVQMAVEARGVHVSDSRLIQLARGRSERAIGQPNTLNTCTNLLPMKPWRERPCRVMSYVRQACTTRSLGGIHSCM